MGIGKSFYSAVELAAMKLPGLPSAAKNMLAKAERECWVKQRRSGRGGGWEYAVSSLPLAVQEEIKNRQVQELLGTAKPAALQAAAAKQLTLTLNNAEELTDSQRETANSRCALAAEVLNVARILGKKKAAEHVAHAAQARSLPFELQQLVDRANAKSNEDRAVSARTLLRWCAAFESTESPSKRLLLLAPRTRQPDTKTPWWLGEFMAQYRRPAKPSLTESYKEFCRALAEHDELPSIDAVRRALKKLPPAMLYAGRHTGAALRAKLPFVRRDWSKLQPGDVWVGDGHGFKAKIINPETGKPQVMEFTAALDGASRLCVGWSVALSENVLAVSDMLRHALTHFPPPLIYYSDNGAGETGKTLDAPLTGILPRCGIHHETGIPGNAQGRGLIERFWQTVALPLARRYGTYQGAGADRDTLRKVSGDISKAITAQKQQRDGLTVVMPHAPSLEQFMADLTQAVAEYNATPHSALPKRDGAHMTPREYYEAHCRPDDQVLPAVEVHDLFRPTFVRIAQRGEVQLWNNVYFSRDLIEVDGQQVQVGVDFHDPSTVVIRTMAGRFVCEAEVNGNKRAAFPVSLRDKLLDERIKGKVKRAQDKIADAHAERGPVLQLGVGEVLPGISGKDIAGAFERLPIQREAIDVPVRIISVENSGFTVPGTPAERIALHQQLQIKGELSERESKWLASYAKSHEFKVMSLKHATADQAVA